MQTIEKSTIIAMIFVTLISLFFTTIQTTPVSAFSVGTTPRDITPAEEPACPGDFPDAMGFGDGTATHANFSQAVGNAELLCDSKLAEGKAYQNEENATNRATCEAVPGCVFSSSITNNSTDCEATIEDCTPTTDASGNRIKWTCRADGLFDIANYNCSRPPKPKDPKLV
jgi:hypothetical protein